MPDPKKLERARQIGYRILPTCGTCRHARIKPAAPGSSWGDCPKQPYEHESHGPRFMSIYAAGTCDQWEMSDESRATLEKSGYTEFVREGS